MRWIEEEVVRNDKNTIRLPQQHIHQGRKR